MGDFLKTRLSSNFSVGSWLPMTFLASSRKLAKELFETSEERRIKEHSTAFVKTGDFLTPQKFVTNSTIIHEREITGVLGWCFRLWFMPNSWAWKRKDEATLFILDFSEQRTEAYGMGFFVFSLSLSLSLSSSAARKPALIYSVHGQARVKEFRLCTCGIPPKYPLSTLGRRGIK